MLLKGLSRGSIAAAMAFILFLYLIIVGGTNDGVDEGLSEV
jgi:hypothetical protein